MAHYAVRAKRIALLKPYNLVVDKNAVHFGTSLRYARIAGEAERWLRLPVFSIGVAIY